MNCWGYIGCCGSPGAGWGGMEPDGSVGLPTVMAFRRGRIARVCGEVTPIRGQPSLTQEDRRDQEDRDERSREEQIAALPERSEVSVASGPRACEGARESTDQAIIKLAYARAVLEQLRKPRYLALGAVMVLVAAVCIGAGTWQVFRFKEKHDANHLLRHNARAHIAPLPGVLVTTTTPGAKQRAEDARFRRVSVTGTYDVSHQTLVRERTVDGTVGFLVLTPLRASGAPVLLVVRGFVAADGNAPTAVAAPPAGSVTVTARVEAPELRNDHFGAAAPGQVNAINPISAARRLGEPVYEGYAELLDKQPGGSGLTPIPDPDLSNPAGGAVEPQHVAYILQWYLFALLALAAPLVMARSESRDPDATARAVDAIDEIDQPDARTPTAEQSAHAARMTDRYGGVRAP